MGALELQVLLFVAALFVLGALLLWCAGIVRGDGARELWPLYLDELLIVAAVVLPVLFGGVAFVAALLALSLRGTYEHLEMAAPYAASGLRLACHVGAALLLLLACLAPAALLVPLVLLPLAAALPPATGALATWARATLFPGLAVAGIALFAHLPDGRLLLLLVYVVIESNDASALLFGRLFGRHRPFPRLSPGKTGAGLLGGVLVALPVGWCFGWLLLERSPGVLLAAVAAALAAGLAGDLLTSAVKRHFGRKDFAALLPRHGGALDLYDALLFAAPTVALLAGLGLLGPTGR